jgi:hypothetical protein
VRAEKFSVRACTLNFGVARKNVGVQYRAINLALCGMHTHNNNVCGVRSVGTAQWTMVVAHAMWVNVVARQFSEWCAVGRTKLWHGVVRRVKCVWNISTRYKNCTRWILARGTKTVYGPKTVCGGYWRAT